MWILASATIPSPLPARKLAKWLFEHSLTQVVYFHECNAGGIVHTAQDRGVVARWQICYDRLINASWNLKLARFEDKKVSSALSTTPG
jgi:hypothetical protein